MRDVVVVGAGPAGSYAAYTCSSLGLDTLLLDKNSLPREKACGGVAGRDLITYCGKGLLDIVERESDGSQLYYNHNNIGFLDKEKLFFKREKLDYFITEMAEEAGCELNDRTNVTGVSVYDDGAKIATDKGELRSRIVIGADGSYSVVRKSLGLSIEKRRHYAAIRSRVELSKIQNEELLEIGRGTYQHTHFFSDLLGFAWLIPNEDCLNIGMGVMLEKSSDLRRRFEAFLAHFDLDRNSLTKGHLIPYRPLDRVYSERVLLVGDAGGFVNPWTGCGIDLGVESAKSAGEVCRMVVDEDDYSRRSMSRYQDAMGPTLTRLRFRSSAISLLDDMTPRNFVMKVLGKVFVKRLSRFA